MLEDTVRVLRLKWALLAEALHKQIYFEADKFALAKFYGGKRP